MAYTIKTRQEFKQEIKQYLKENPIEESYEKSLIEDFESKDLTDLYKLFLDLKGKKLDDDLLIKLKNIVGEDKRITETLINENIDRSLSENIFEILTAAFDKKYQEATQRLEDHLREGASAIQLLAIFESQFEFLTCVKVLQNRRWSKDQITKELKVNPYRVKLALENKVSLSKLTVLLKQAIELDFGYKNGTYHGDEFLKLFLLKI